MLIFYCSKLHIKRQWEEKKIALSLLKTAGGIP